MNRTLVFLSLLFTLQVRAQTLTLDDFFQIGDQFSRQQVEAGSVEPGPEGAGQHWRFSSLVDTQQETIAIVSPGQTPTAGTFGAANLAEVRTRGDRVRYIYWQLDSTGLTYVGAAQDNVLIQFTDLVLTTRFPLQSGDRHEDHFSGTANPPGITVSQEGTLSSLVDASGTITTPQGTFENALRIKTVQTIVQTGSVPGLPQQLMITTWSWHVPERGYPVFTISETVSTGRGQQETQREAYYTLQEPNTQEPSVWLPHLALFGGNFVSEIYLVNKGEAASEITLHPYTAAGVRGASLQYSLQPGQVRTLTHEQLGAETSHLGVSGCHDCTASVGYRAANGGGTAQVHQTTGARSFMIYPGEWDVLFDGMALVNIGEETSVIRGEVLGSDGAVIDQRTISPSLAPGAKLLANFAATFEGNSGHAIRIESSQDAVIMMLRGSLDGKFLYQDLPLADAPAEKPWIAHLALFGGNFTTALYAYNGSTEARSLSLTTYSSEGHSLDTLRKGVGPSGFLEMTHESLGSTTSHLSLDTKENTVVTVGYRAASGGGTAHVHQTKPATEYLIYPGEWDVLFDGMAAVNTGAEPVSIVAEVLDAQGGVLTSRTLATELVPGAKILSNFAQVFEGQSGALIRIRADQPLAILMLRGSLDGKFLYQNLPL